MATGSINVAAPSSGNAVRVVSNTGVDGAAYQEITTIADSAGNLLGTNAGPMYVTGSTQTQTASFTATNQYLQINQPANGIIVAQVSGTWAGTITLQGSVDGVNYVALTSGAQWFSRTSASFSSTITGNSVYQSTNPGIPFLRFAMTTYTSGTAAVAVTSAPGNAGVVLEAPLPAGSNALGNVVVSTLPSTPAGTNVTGSVASANHSNDAIYTTALAASGVYTSTSIDMGATPSVWRTRARALIAHTAGLAWGQLQLQQSEDNTTWRITAAWPVPSDGYNHAFEGTLHRRYWRWVFTNGATAQTAFFFANYSVNEAAPLESRQNLQFPVTQTALAASAGFTSSTMDLGPNHNWDRIRVVIRSDQAGAAYVQQSRDSSTWFTTRPSDITASGTSNADGVAVAATSGSATLMEVKIVARYVRMTVGNGSTAQTVLDVNAALINL